MALTAEKKRLKLSLNQTVIELLSHSLGVEKNGSNGLAQLAGTWTPDEHTQFEEAVAPSGQIDEDLWR